MKKLRINFVILILVVLVLGFGAGVIGELWLNSFLLPEPYLDFKSYSDLSGKIDELLQNQKTDINLHQRDLAIHETIQKVRPGLVKIYYDKNFSSSSVDTLLPDQLLGQGAMITSDGWLMTAANVLPTKNRDYWVVADDHKLYKSEEIMIDQDLGVAFLKIKAGNLPVMEFSLKNNLVDGQSVFLFGFNGGIAGTNIKDRNYSDLSTLASYKHSSDEFYKFINLCSEVEKEFLGSPVITLDGKMAGFVSDTSGLVVPIDHLSSVMSESVQGQEWARPYLGVKFYDLSEILNPEIDIKKGARIAERGIAFKSPLSGLVEPGDIIIEVEGEEINKQNNLPKILAAYKPGDKLELGILVGGEEQEKIKVELGGIDNK